MILLVANFYITTSLKAKAIQLLLSTYKDRILNSFVAIIRAINLDSYISTAYYDTVNSTTRQLTICKCGKEVFESRQLQWISKQMCLRM